MSSCHLASLHVSLVCDLMICSHGREYGNTWHIFLVIPSVINQHKLSLSLSHFLSLVLSHLLCVTIFLCSWLIIHSPCHISTSSLNWKDTLMYTYICLTLDICSQLGNANQLQLIQWHPESECHLLVLIYACHSPRSWFIPSALWSEWDKKKMISVLFWCKT